MPWFPDFANAVALSRKETRVLGQSDPAEQYLAALEEGDLGAIETVWPGEVVVHDPRAGEVRGHRRLREFVHHNHVWLTERHARVETVAATRTPGRAVLELLVQLTDECGSEVTWPVAVVAESTDSWSVEFRTYCSQWPVDGRRPRRSPVVQGVADWPATFGRYGAALAGGDVTAAVAAFAPGGYYREPIGPHSLHSGAEQLRQFFAQAFSAGGGIGLRPCLVTETDSRCAIEYDCVRWGRHELPAQAGLCVLERRPDGLLSAVRVYDDVEQPVG